MASLFSATSSRQHELELHNPALCEELRIRDILDSVGVMTNGTFVAAYELSGVHSYYHTEDMRNRAKESFEAVLRSMPERSMRLHLRFEIRQDTGNVIGRYAELHTKHECGSGVRSMKSAALDGRRKKPPANSSITVCTRCFIGIPVIHQSEPGHEWEHKLRRNWSLSAGKCIQRTRGEHDRLLSEFTSLLAGIETTLASTGMLIQRLA